MADELPYFKFRVSSWISGRITLEKMDVQGLFINICALYWQRSGELTLTEAKRRLSNAKPKAFHSLIENGLITVEKDFLTITFLDEQLEERQEKHEINRANGLLGGRPKKPKAFDSLTETKGNKIREEEKREDKKVDHALASNVFSFLQRKGSNTSEVNYMVLQWQKEGVTDIMEQLKAMKEYYKREGLTFPTKIDTIRQSLPSADWIQKIRESNPVQYGKPADPDTIGTSAPGSLE